MKLQITVAVLCGFLLGCNQDSQQPAQDKLRSQAHAIGNATLRGEYGKVIDLTYPRFVEFAGGREKLLEIAKSSMQEAESKGLKLLSYTVGASQDIVHAGGKSFAVVPTTIRMKTHGGMVTAEGFLLGVADDGKQNWTFLDGNGLDDEDIVKSVVPETIGKVSLPAKKNPVFEKTE